ncbi:hypothetical protein BDV98DRAFT_570475 [Pterulicium gracile]|uniref:FAD/NAD(P)-binding domain-containing protein n=1 Tax=Pterulicium gracile TaxID=1884261 RepID=A0A5C3QEF3_9AGAR|nr:hypothetical protein BDV98DRAFT_570475 [Pterula gracilis]
MHSWTIAAAGLTASLLVYFFTLLRAKRFWLDEQMEVVASPRVGPRHGKVVICGGGIAGVLAAKQCLNHFEEVVLVDPEFSKTLFGTPKSRIMQYYSIHGYVIPFAEGLRRLWPSFDQRAKEAGQAPFDGNHGLHVDGAYVSTFTQKVPSSFHMRRRTLEPLLHRLLVNDTPEAKDRLTIIDGTISSLKAPSDEDRITKVDGRLVNGGEFEVKDIDLFIDCSGRAQCGIKWLENAGYAAPRRVSYTPHLRYATVNFTIPDEISDELPLSLSESEQSSVGYLTGKNADLPSQMQLVSFARMDNGCGQLCFCLRGSGKLPKTSEDLVPAIKEASLSVPAWFIDMITLLVETASPVISTAQLGACSHIEYHELSRLPSNFVAIGDAAMVVNPIFGQGCGKAMFGVLLLDKMLRQTPAGHFDASFSKRFFNELYSRTEILWHTNKSMDYAYATTTPCEGETLAYGRFSRWMGKVFMQAASEDGRVSHALGLTRHLMASQSAIINPSMLVRVSWAHLRRAARRVFRVWP